MKRFLFGLLACALGCGWQSCSAAQASEASRTQPNVVLILADDLALGDLAHRNGGISQTPNLDRLAESSVQFRNAYSGSCVCAPARAALLTGRYPHRTGVVTLNQERYPSLTQLRRDETTIADVLREQGYATGLIGKWHCGMGSEYHPLQRGFDEFTGFIGPNSYFHYRLDVNGTITRDNEGYLTDELSRRAIDFVRRHRDRPFFLHLAHYAPHRPLQAPESRIDFYRAKGLDESTATIYAMVEIMDRGIGEFLEELERLQLASQTLVIFASDNGPDPITGTRFNEQRRGTKYEVYEGGIRVPLFFRWPGRFVAADRDQPVHFVDVYPTILAACGVEVERKLPLDGVSLLENLDGQPHQSTRNLFWQWNRGHPNYTHNAAVLDGNWKLVKPFVTRAANPEDSQQSAVLYDLSSGGAETTDLSADHPERYETMLRALNEWSDGVERDRRRSAE